MGVQDWRHAVRHVLPAGGGSPDAHPAGMESLRAALEPAGDDFFDARGVPGGQCPDGERPGLGFDRGVVKSQIMPDLSSAPFRLDRSLVCESQNVLTLFAPADVKGFKVFNKSAWVLLNNTLTKDGKPNYEGTGFTLDEPFEHPSTCQVSSHDMLTLNDGRLTMLNSNRITEDSLQELTETARQVADKAQQLVKAIRAAAARVAHIAVKTPLVEAAFPGLSGYGAGKQIWLKAESLQPIGAFKIRGAANKIL